MPCGWSALLKVFVWEVFSFGNEMEFLFFK
jgi:hypothetical protein